MDRDMRKPENLIDLHAIEFVACKYCYGNIYGVVILWEQNNVKDSDCKMTAIL